VVSLNTAESSTARAIRLANRGDYHAATAEFSRALQLDARFDLTRCEGFWGMQSAGHVAAAKAYLQFDRSADARSLLTVVKLSCGSHRELELLLGQVAGFVRA
jgi:D-alanyl-D-alanine carboxypeptidase (penicillin-binding protein 5/6)